MSTVNDAEIDRFARLAGEWWDETGRLAPLHRLNPVRLAYIRENALARFGRDGAARRPFEGLKIVDIGCGGGLLCEPMARLGASVVGIDATEANIEIARHHAAEAGLEIDYRYGTAEALAEAGQTFDVVLAMEVIEHVDNVLLFVRSCAKLVAPGGLIFVATINRTARALALAIVAAETVLRWLPRGSHQYEKLLTPDEVETLLKRNGLMVIDGAGVTYHPIADEWRRSEDLGINYMVAAAKPVG